MELVIDSNRFDCLFGNSMGQLSQMKRDEFKEIFLDLKTVYSNFILLDYNLNRGEDVWVDTKFKKHEEYRIFENFTFGDNLNIEKGEGVVIGKRVTIGKNCTIERGVTISKGVTIGDNVFIGKYAVIKNDIEDNASIPQYAKY